MCPRRAALLAVIWTFYMFSGLPQVTTTGVFELQIQSFRNDLGVTNDGACCNGYRQNGICSAPCRTYFKICLAHYQADIASNPQPRCTFANFTTPVLGDNTMDFGVMSELPLKPSRQNTVYFPVTEFSWPKDFSLVIEAWHNSEMDSPDQGHQSLLIARLAEIRSASSGKAWYTYERTFSSQKLKYAFRFVCDTNYYGANCAELCRPRDDKFGHYTCSSNGTKVCLNGWDGEYCETALCLPGCDANNGFCDQPSECKCRVGYQGKFCNDCTPFPGCQRGHCETKPFQCVCEEGWGGLYCNQDLNFCTHNKPCKNGAVCKNIGPGGYNCTCVGSYTGVNCEIEVDDCKNKPCMNNGNCKDIGNGFQCQCPKGFYGRQCEKEANSCKANPCMYGSTCEENEELYYCVCQPGYTGFNCDMAVNECDPSPCGNGGRCIDQINGYRCVCPVGYSGAQCQNNDDDCHQKPCLNNGICVDLVNDFRCQCVPGFVGTLCQDNVDDCEMRPCANGGRCTDLVNDFQCNCAPGFEGKDCSIQINECKSNPCLHGGICKDLFADYSCSCPEGFWGKNCHLSEDVTMYVINNDVSSHTNTTEQPPQRTSPANGDTAGQIAPAKEENDHDRGLTTMEFMLILFFGGVIPLIFLIIIAAVLVLCRKRSFHQQRDTQQNLENLAREKEQCYINNMNNRSGEIFTTLPSSASNSSSIKISNEEQQDINRLKAKHLMLDCDSLVCSEGGGGGSSDGSVLKMPTSVSKQLLHNLAASAHHHELPSTSAVSPTSTASGTFSSRASLGSECDFDYEKPFRMLDVDSLQAEARRPLSEYQTYHSRDFQTKGKSKLPEKSSTGHGKERCFKTSAHSPIYVSSLYRAPSPPYAARSLTPPQQQQQSLLPQQQYHQHSQPSHPHSLYEEEYFATEV